MLKQLTAKRNGFTLVELAVVIVIIGVLAAFGVPRFLKSVERSKAAEAFAYLTTVRAAQERYQARQGTYASDLTQLDIEMQTPKYFSVGTCTATEATWSLTLTRLTGSSGYGQYTVTYTQDGIDPSSGIVALPDINPMSS
jgi:prepilin-type N-terminal cleavage/methylation domain-containing protein